MASTNGHYFTSLDCLVVMIVMEMVMSMMLMIMSRILMTKMSTEGNAVS